MQIFYYLVRVGSGEVINIEMEIIDINQIADY